MEGIVFKYLYNYFHSNNLFHKYQAGFLPGHATVYQLIETYDILKAVDERKLSYIVFCGLSKALSLLYTSFIRPNLEYVSEF